MSAPVHRGLLRDSVRSFASRHRDFARLRAARRSPAETGPEVMRGFADLGWLGILVPEEHDGLGLGFAEMAIVLEELGGALLAGPLAAHAFCARVIGLCGNDALRRSLLPALVAGESIPCLAWQEAHGGIDPQRTGCRAKSVPGGRVVLEGEKRFVAGAVGAGGYLVTARGEAGAGIYWVEAGTEGIETSIEWRVDGTPSTCLRLHDVVVGRDAVVADGDQADAVMARAIDEAAVLVSAEMLGVMKAALAMSLEYLRVRKQFDRPLGSFQSLQHRAADLYIQQELSQAVVSEAVEALDSGTDGEGRTFVTSRAKHRTSLAGLRITREAIQMHGALGMTDEYDLGLYVKRALVLSASLGNADLHLRRYAGLERDRLDNATGRPS